MKAAIHKELPRSPVVDLSHDVPPGDVWGGAFCLEAVLGSLPRPSIILAVVDPGVGSARKILVVKSAGRIFVGPDNGLLTSAISGGKSFFLDPSQFEKGRTSSTFQGRDIMAPVAAALARGRRPSGIGRPMARPQVLKDLIKRPARTGSTTGFVRWVDNFGNLLTSLRHPLSPPGRIRIRRRTLKMKPYYAAARNGELFAHWESHGFLEIARKNGSAARALRANPGLKVQFLPDPRST